jgi:hypothetical protein
MLDESEDLKEEGGADAGGGKKNVEKRVDSLPVLYDCFES